MPQNNPINRFHVTLHDSFNGENTFEFCRAVSEYAGNLRHWKLLGSHGLSPFSDWVGLPWEKIDGAMGLELTPDMEGLAQSKGVAIVSVTPKDRQSPLPQVNSDYHAVGRLGAEHLLERGYTNFAYIGNDSWPSAHQQEGFLETLRAAGRNCETRSIEDFKTDAILKMLRHWLEEFPKPIGIMTVMDYLSRFTVNTAIDLGLRVPSEVGVLGVNNNRWASIMSAVPISSVQLDERRMGQTAARTLDALMQGRRVEPVQRIPPLRVIARRSTDILPMQDPLVGRAIQFIRDHAERGIGVEEVLMDSGCSRSTLEKKMKQELGYTIHTAITRARVEKAKSMLLSSEAGTDQIAYHCGFEHQPRLFEAFKRVTGMTPGEYRRSMRGVSPTHQE
ncbi:MAG: helix-turn-helix domain-containing protein [Phycisphaera sp.]|nr:helix-turn-helix domain-containing protein [Phycisphaera sp.]